MHNRESVIVSITPLREVPLWKVKGALLVHAVLGVLYLWGWKRVAKLEPKQGKIDVKSGSFCRGEPNRMCIYPYHPYLKLRMKI